jgi:hypothetical protein
LSLSTFSRCSVDWWQTQWHVFPSLLALGTNDVITGAVVEPVFVPSVAALGVNVILTGVVVVAVFVPLLPVFIIRLLIT